MDDGSGKKQNRKIAWRYLSEIFDLGFLKNIKVFSIYVLVYTIIFLLFFRTITYTFPFIIAFFIALIIQPISKFLQDKLKLKKSITSLMSSVLVYAIFFTIVSFLFYKIIDEVRQLLRKLSNADIDLIVNWSKDIIERLGQYFNEIDPGFIEENSSQIAEVISNSTDVVGKILNTLISIAVYVPVLITIIFVIGLSTYFFTRDMDAIKKKALSIFSHGGREKFSNVWYQGIKMLLQYIKAYSIVYSLTFIQTLIGFSVLGVRYAVILSIVCAISDVLPVLGIGLIYLPLSVIYLVAGNYFVAAGLIILYVIITVVRQIVEPKIVSTSLGVHPVLVLAMIFIGFKAYGFIGMIYLVFLVLFYKVLKAAKVV